MVGSASSMWAQVTNIWAVTCAPHHAGNRDEVLIGFRAARAVVDENETRERMLRHEMIPATRRGATVQRASCLRYRLAGPARDAVAFHRGRRIEHSVVENEGDLQVDSVLLDDAVVANDLLLLDPCTTHPP